MSRLPAALVSLAVAAAATLLLPACGGGTASSSMGSAETLSAQAALGERIFSDQSLSASGRQSCFDLGLCARPGGDLASRGDLCGAFKVPSLRNVALRKALFHNGRFKSLKDALSFYVQRDTNPEKFYPRNADGSVNKFDDLPAAYKANVNTTEAPYNRKAGDAPALSDAEIDDVIAFLQTLSDGYRP